jgi:serine/threonine protein kinase
MTECYPIENKFNTFLSFLFQPENILLDDNLNVKLSDFGFATVLGPNEELAGKIISENTDKIT